MAAALVLGLAACGSSGSSVAPSAPAAGTVTGEASITKATGLDEIYVCAVSAYTAGTTVAAADVDWSGIASHSFSSKTGFDYQGDVRAPGFACTLSGPKFKFGNSSDGSAQAFTITGFAPGRHALVVTLGQTARLVSGDDGVPVTVELSADHGADVGSVTVK